MAALPAPDPVPEAVELADFVEAFGDDRANAAADEQAARALVVRFIGGEGNPARVPAPVLRKAILEVGADLYSRRTARNGVATFGNADGLAVMRIARDPMTAAYPLLRPFVPNL